MAELLIDEPDAHVFWTAFDPLDLASESIDPLGFMAGYIALADRILPGFTTITTVPRYASMLCYALQAGINASGGFNAEDPSTRRKRIMERLKLLERAWALACGLAEGAGGLGDKATNGLRGVRAVRRFLRLHEGKEKISLSYDLLSNQIRYGGIGTYGTFLEMLHLADMASLTLRPLGERLAQAFPAPDAYGLPTTFGDVRLPVEALVRWGIDAHVSTLTTDEARWLRDALQGGEEAEFDDHARWVMLRVIRDCDPQLDMEESHLLSLCLSRLRRNSIPDVDPAGQGIQRLTTALRHIEPYERMYQGFAFLFDRIRAMALDRGQASLASIAHEPAVESAAEAVRQAATDLLTKWGATGNAQMQLGPACARLRELGIVELARTLAGTSDARAICQEVLRRHARVQDGKFDGGLPKGPWIRFEVGSDDRVVLTQQRYGLEPGQARSSWTAMARHPYRTEGARRFIRLCRIS